MECDLGIIGAGPAGLSAAIYAGRRKAKTIVFEDKLAGGSMNVTPAIENYPGFKRVDGAELGKKMREQAESLETIEFVDKEVVDASGAFPAFSLKTADGREFKAKAIILATGAEYRKLGVPGSKEFEGRGVVYCATCDAPLFAGKAVAVVGGGNNALNTALLLADTAKKVFLVHRRDEFRAEQVLVDRLKGKANAEFVLNAVPTKVTGDKMVSGLECEDVKTKEKKTLEVEGVFVSIGVTPVSELATKLGAETTDNGYVKTDLKTCATTAKGVFAAGDVTGWWRQVVAACAQGGVAATNAVEAVKQK